MNSSPNTNLFFLVFLSDSDHPEQSCCPADDSTLQLLDSSHQHLSSQELRGESNDCGGDRAEDGITHSTSPDRFLTDWLFFFFFFELSTKSHRLKD